MKQNIHDRLKKIDPDHYTLLTEIGEVASALSLKAYLAGGMVRDLLLGYDNLDIDIVVENNCLLLVDALTKKFSNCKLSAKHDRFHTAKLVFCFNGKNIPVDLASTREEIYEFPAALPKVKITDLKKDLYRRDFTINALAVSLMPDEFGNVVDLFDGLSDLKNNKIKILHDFSFIDDPTRMIRAVRFACKLGFEIEEYTKELLKKAIDSKQFDNLIEKIRGDRVKIEIRYLFNLSDVEVAIEKFFSSGIYRMVSTELKPCRDTINRISTIHQWLIVFALLIKDLSLEKQEKIMNNLQMTGDEIKIIKDGFTAYNRLHTLNESKQKIDSIVVYRELKDHSHDSVYLTKLLLLNSQLSALSSQLDEFLEKTSKIKLEITGKDLINMGLKEGKIIGEILEKVLELKIKNPKMKKEDELREARKIIP